MEQRRESEVLDRQDKEEEKQIGENGLFSGLGRFLSPISSDTLSVLSNMKSFLILPNNTDKVGHYFEAQSEEMRDE